MTSIPVEQLTFTFDPSVDPFQYEVAGGCIAGWPHGSKVVDVVAHDLSLPASLTWLIEAKDFRLITNPPKPTNLAGLAATVEAKVRDSLAALPVVAAQSANAAAQAHALVATATPARRVVLHLEPHPAAGLHAALTPASWIANVLLQLRINLVDIDPNPLVLDIARTPAAKVPWTVS
ncbi:MAG: hypothetical protein ACKOPS_20875 [Cyanobium sp.]